MTKAQLSAEVERLRSEGVRLLCAFHLNHQLPEDGQLTVLPISDCPHPLCREAQKSLGWRKEQA